MVKGRFMIPVHWGTFNLSYHAWVEPVERLLTVAEKTGLKVVVPKPGQFVDPDNPPELDRWWSDY